MVTESNKIIVKVGDTSGIQFANSKVYRAITASELGILTSKNDDCNIIIIEKVYEDEEDTVAEVLKSFKNKDDRHSVLFYINDEHDEITSGVADELDADIFLNVKDLYKSIFDTYGINVSTFIDDKIAFRNKSEALPDGITDVFGVEDSNTEDITNTLNEINEVETEQTVETTKVVETQQTTQTVEQAVETQQTTQTEEQTAQTEEQTTVEEENKNLKTEVYSTDNTEELSEDNKNSISADVADYIDKLKMQLRDIKEDYKSAVKDIQDTNNQIKILENTVRILEDEKKVMIDKYNGIMANDDILEDPITLAEYSGIKQHSEQLDDQLIELRKTLNTVKEQSEAKDLDINSYKTTIEELEQNIENLNTKHNEEIEELSNKYNEDIEELKSDSDRQINGLKEQNSSLSNNITELNSTVEKLHNDIDGLSERLKNEVVERVNYVNITQSAIVKFKELNEQINTLTNSNDELQNKLSEADDKIRDGMDREQEQLETINNLKESLDEAERKISNIQSFVKENSENNKKVSEDELNRLKDKYEKKIEALNSSNKLKLSSLKSDYEKKLAIADLNKQNEVKKASEVSKDTISKLEAQLQITNSSSNTKIQELSDQIEQLEAELNITKSNLANKEEQYDSLVAESGIDENGVSALRSANRELENMASKLRGNLQKANQDLVTAKRIATQQQNEANKLKQENISLKQTMSGMASSSGSIINIPSIQPGTGAGKVITVCGSGSGSTTVAMTLANRLAITDNVLYVDMDMTYPVADAWFNKAPFINKQISDLIRTDKKVYGLTYMIEEPEDKFEANINRLTINISSTRQGKLSYLSGLHRQLQETNIVNANYGNFIDVLTRNFTYIVMDFCKIGSSVLTDNVYRVISEIANCNVLVTRNDRFDIIKCMDKLSEANAFNDRMVWLLNLSEGTKIEDIVKRKINENVASGKYYLIPKSTTLKNREILTRSIDTRDRFNQFLTENGLI